MVGKLLFRLSRPQAFVLWAVVTALPAVGLLTTLVDFTNLSALEARRASEQRQRFLINPSSGEITIAADAAATDKPDEQFDVAAKEEESAAVPEAEGEAAAAAQPPEATEADSPLPQGLPTLREQPMEFSITTPTRSAISLVAAPAPEITELVDGMKLPKRGDKDMTPSALYAQPFKRIPEQVLLSFVVMDAGIDQQAAGLLMGMPREISIAFSPYARQNIIVSENMRLLGHEVWTMLPTMTSRYPHDDPGPMGLIAQMPPEEIARRLREVLASVPGSVGMVLSTDENFSVQKNALLPVVSEINKRGLIMLATNPSRSIEQITADATLAAIIRRADLVLDPEPNESQIRSRLAGLLASASEKGEYIIALSARSQSLQLLAEWLKDNHLTAPMQLAPLSAIYQPKETPEASPAQEDSSGHGGGNQEKPKPKPVARKAKILPQDQYRQPAGKESGGGH